MSDANADTTTVRGRKPRFNPEARVTVNLEPNAVNPMKLGKKNAELFDVVRGLTGRGTTTTVGAARAAGVPYGYLEFYARKGYVTIDGAVIAAAAE